MSMNSVGRPTRPESADVNDYVHPTLTGARGLLQDEALIFELNAWDKTGSTCRTPRRPMTWAIWSARRRSACRACRSRKRCATTCA